MSGLACPVNHPLVQRLWVEHMDVVERYQEPHRVYHDVDHLESVVTMVLELSTEYPDADLEVMVLGAIYHDAVYELVGVDNEGESAVLARERIGGVLGDRVGDVVMGTVPGVVPGTVEACIVHDADFAVLGGPWSRYEVYADEVRREFGVVSDGDYCRGRVAVLERLLSGRLFFTSVGALWEPFARDNMLREVERLRGSVV